MKLAAAVLDVIVVVLFHPCVDRLQERRATGWFRAEFRAWCRNSAPVASGPGRVVTPVQRLVVVLVAVYAARAAALRQLTVDDVDLSRRRIRIDGAVQPMPDLVHRLLREWHASAPRTEPVSDYYLSCHLAMQDVPLERLRADRVLHEAVAVDADPLHLAQAFTLSAQTAIDYSEIARDLLARPVEDHTPGASVDELE